MLSAPDEYRQFARSIKRVVLMDVLYRALQCDIRQLELQTFKLKQSVLQTLSYTSIQVERELQGAKRQLRQSGGHIIEVKQKRDYREVRARFRGFIYTQRFFNEWIKAECEEWLVRLWTGKTTSQTFSAFRSS
ncbi:hypothetical protein [Desmospora activa]|uniref:Uncharacterized protein n=1 Tax=Desmospora activa DSM 45169 TaxID=1121389 RepID=A0A2T4ZDF2_9BACL|nr:hypothetical protein [Desmospora activa]PTM59896.1 hypothetical protein C8J48_2533 [Desmospora activa DSM 45169]